MNYWKIRKGKAAKNTMAWAKLLSAKPLEKDIQKQIVEYLERAGIQASVTNADRTWGKGGGVRTSKVPKGHPDITAVLPVVYDGFVIGLAWYIEVKTPTGSIKQEQRDKLAALAKAGALCTVARDVDTVIRIVTQLKGRPWKAADKKRFDDILALTLYSRRTKAVREAIESLLVSSPESQTPQETR